METISQRLKKKREEMNLSQAQLAKKSWHETAVSAGN